jgi:hypothetical protein
MLCPGTASDIFTSGASDGTQKTAAIFEAISSRDKSGEFRNITEKPFP